LSFLPLRRPRLSALSLGCCSALVLSACVSDVPGGRRPETGRPQERVIYPVPGARPAPAMPARHDPSLERPAPGLSAEIGNLWRAFPGKTGIAIKRIDGDWEIGQRGGDLFPQQSVSKLWVSLTILHLIDQNKGRLDDRLRIGMNDLAVFHSPVRDRVVAGGTVEMTVRELMERAITGSDNTANDRLLWYAGGPSAVRAFIAAKGLGAIRFGPGERAMQSAIAGLEWKQDYAVGSRFFAARETVPLSNRRDALNRYIADPVDGASPMAIVNALSKLARGELLSPASTRLILDIMARTTSGPNRLKGGLPPGWTIAHKTGTGQVLGGLATGYNDVGIITAPDGTRYAVAVMLGDTTAAIGARMRLMQAVSNAVARYHGL